MRLFVPAAFLLTAVLPLCAQTPAKRPMAFADLAGMKRVSDPQISPSGKWVLFSVTDVVLEKNSKTNHLWVVPLETGARDQGTGSSERQVTSGTGESNGRFSPDGKLVMYTANDDKGRSEIFVAPWDEAAGRVGVGHAVTALETEADGGIWAPDSQHFLFVSSVYPECEGHAPQGPQRNQEEQVCNEVKDAIAEKNPVQARVFDHLLYRHWNQFMGPKHSHIFYAGLDGAAPTDLTPASVVGDHEAPTFSLGGPLGYAISPDGKEVAYSVNLDKVPAESTNNDIFILQLGAEPKSARKVSTSLGSDDGPQYSPDGRWLAWRSQKRAGFESDKFRLLEMDRASGKIHDVLPDFDGWVDEFIYSNPKEPGGGGSFFYITSSAKGEEPILVGPKPVYEWKRSTAPGQANTPPPPPPSSLDIKRVRMTADGSKTPSAGEYSSMQISADGRWLAYVGMTVGKPSEVFVHMASACDQGDMGCVMGGVKGEFVGGQITHLNDALLSQLELPQMESFSSSGANNTKVQGFLIRPPNFDPSKKYPLKFLIHGGPQGAWGDAWSYRWNPELLAANGYVVVMINPRGSTGYGQQFTDEVSGDWGGRAYTDLMRGLDYAEQHYPFIDKTRECALGASYGGYMANWVLTHTDRFKCIVTHDGMYNPQSAFGTTEELWFNEWEFRETGSRKQEAGSSGRRAGVNADSSATLRNDKKSGVGHEVVEQGKPAHPWDFYDKPASEDPFRKWSPMLAIKNAHTPTLVIHGQRDYRLDVSEGFQLFTALQLLGVPSKMLYFPDEGHWVMKPKNSELWYETVNDWCDRWTNTGKYAGAQGAGIREQGAGRDTTAKVASPKVDK